MLREVGNLGVHGVAAALKVHNVDLEFLAVLADLGGRTIEAGHALRDRPRDVLRKHAGRLAAASSPAWRAGLLPTPICGRSTPAGSTTSRFG